MGNEPWLIKLVCPNRLRPGAAAQAGVLEGSHPLQQIDLLDEGLADLAPFLRAAILAHRDPVVLVRAVAAVCGARPRSGIGTREALHLSRIVSRMVFGREHGVHRFKISGKDESHRRLRR